MDDGSLAIRIESGVSAVKDRSSVDSGVHVYVDLDP
jgi:hypothetical protein